MMFGWLFDKRKLEQRADENELDCLEEMVNAYVAGKYENDDYIDKCFESVAKNLEQRPSLALLRRREVLSHRFFEARCRRGLG